MAAYIKDQTAMATRLARKVRESLLPKWYLRNGVINATESELESASSSCELWIKWFAWLVIVSVVLESVIAFVEPPYGLFLKLSVATDVGVAVGIVGEVWLGMREGRIQTELRKRSNDKLGAAEKAAGEANDRASVAQAEAAAAMERANNAALEQEKLRAENLELERALAPRLLMLEPAGQKLRPYAALSAIIHFVDDLDASRIAWQIATMLRHTARWKSVELQPATRASAVSDGIEIRYASTLGSIPPRDPPARNAAEMLVDILEESRIDSHTMPSSRFFIDGNPVPLDVIWIAVGMRSPSYFVEKLLPPEHAKRLREARQDAKRLMARSREMRREKDQNP